MPRQARLQWFSVLSFCTIRLPGNQLWQFPGYLTPVGLKLHNWGLAVCFNMVTYSTFNYWSRASPIIRQSTGSSSSIWPASANHFKVIKIIISILSILLASFYIDKWGPKCNCYLLTLSYWQMILNNVCFMKITGQIIVENLSNHWVTSIVLGFINLWLAD